MELFHVEQTHGIASGIKALRYSLVTGPQVFLHQVEHLYGIGSIGGNGG